MDRRQPPGEGLVDREQVPEVRARVPAAAQAVARLVDRPTVPCVLLVLRVVVVVEGAAQVEALKVQFGLDKMLATLNTNNVEETAHAGEVSTGKPGDTQVVGKTNVPAMSPASAPEVLVPQVLVDFTKFADINALGDGEAKQKLHQAVAGMTADGYGRSEPGEFRGIDAGAARALRRYEVPVMDART